MHSYWWFNLDAIAVFLQIALSSTIALASALAIAAHHQSQKCAAPFLPSVRLHSTVALTKPRLTSFAQPAGQFAGAVERRTHSEFSPFLPSQLALSHGCFGWQQGVFAVTGGSCALVHQHYHNQTAAATGPEVKRVVGLLAAISHVISLSTPHVVAGPPVPSALGDHSGYPMRTRTLTSGRDRQSAQSAYTVRKCQHCEDAM